MNDRDPNDRPTCSMCLFYDDVDAAMAFLAKAFGFETDFVARRDDGSAEHAQMRYADACFMVGSVGNPEALRPTSSPKTLKAVHASAYVQVVDVDAHYQLACQAGAEIVMAPEDQFWGDRIYCAVDPEGQFWTFSQKVGDVDMDELDRRIKNRSKTSG